MSSRVVITGYGLITPFGYGPDKLRESLFRNKHAFREIASFDTSASYAKFGAEAPVEDRTYRHFGTYCTEQALQMAGLMPGEEPLLTAAVSIGNLGDGAVLPEYYRQFYAGEKIGRQSAFHVNGSPEPVAISDSIPSMHADAIAELVGSRGVRLAFTNACIASANAIGFGYDQIRFGRTGCAVVGGINVIHPTVYYNFDSSRAMAERVVRPFSADRSGLLIGDGAAVLVLEEMDAALKRGAKPLAEIVGWGISSDGFHVSQPEPEGRGLARAMEMALRRAKLEPQDIDYINAHGTGTPLNDRSETKALKRIFGASAGQIPVSSTKSMTGHMLEATGAVEAVISIIAMLEQRIPPTANYTEEEDGLDLDYVTEGARSAALTYVMSNSCAFGGNNCSLIFRRVG